MTVHTDREADRLLSLRMSSKIPLPPEVCLTDGVAASQFFAHRLFYQLMGVEDHPLIGMLEQCATNVNMSRTLNRASHLDRMSHYAAWLGQEQVRIVDLGDDDIPTDPEVSEHDVEGTSVEEDGFRGTVL